MNVYFYWFGLPGAVVLSAIIWLFALILAVIRPTPARFVCLAAMTLSTVGDVFLARPDGLEERFPNYFIIGAGFFMAAHLVYVLCFSMRLKTLKARFLNVGSVSAAVLGGVVTVAMTVFCIHTKNLSMLPLILAYAAVIFSNCATVLSYSVAMGMRSLFAVAAAVGVISFMLSDLIIGLGIAANITSFDYLIWWLYPIGQILLIISVKK